VKDEIMKLSLKAITLSSAILWGAAMLLAGLLHMAVPSYGGEFLKMMSSVYPGADIPPNLGRVLLGTIYGLVDGSIGGVLFGLLYNAFSRTIVHSNRGARPSVSDPKMAA
jgi:hypothetical protein